MSFIRYISIMLSFVAILFATASCDDAEKRVRQEFHDDTFTELQEEYVNSLSEYSTKDMEVKVVEKTDWSWLEKLFGEDSPFLLIIKGIGYVLVVVMVVFLIRFFMGLNLNHENKKKKGSVNLTTIYNHDFAEEIRESVKVQNWNEAVKLVYLQTLHHLDSIKQINWDESKTPMEYYYEYKTGRLRPTFYNLTVLFLTARYANVETTGEMYGKALQYNKQLTGGEKQTR